MGEKLRKSLEAAFYAAAARNFGQLVSGKRLSGVVEDFADQVSTIHTMPLTAMKQTDIGPVVLIDKTLLLDRTAAQLRADEIIIPNAVPDYAIVVRDQNESLVFAWRTSEVRIDDDQQP